MATYELRESVNLSSEEFPPEVDEFLVARVTKAPSVRVRAARVAESPVQFECTVLESLRLPGDGPIGTVDIVFGRVVAIHIADAILKHGRIDVARIKPLARLGYFQYACVESVFEMPPPGSGIAQRQLGAGLEGTREGTERT